MYRSCCCGAGFFQPGVFSTSSASQQSLAAISLLPLPAAMSFFAVKWKSFFRCRQHSET